MAASHLRYLAQQILEQTNSICDYHDQHGLPEPTFAQASYPEPRLPPQLGAARDAAIHASTELQDLLRGPTGIVRHHMGQFTHLSCMQVLYRYNIAAAVPVDTTISYEDLSTKCGLEVSQLRRFLRYAMTCHIFQESNGLVSHSGASKAILEEQFLRDWMGMITEEWWPSAISMVQALEVWPGSQEPNETGWSLGHKTKATPFEDIAQDSRRAERFAHAMTFTSALPQMSPALLLNAYPWSSFNDGQRTLLVDIGGSQGSVSKAITENFPSVECVVQDRPEVIEKMVAAQQVGSRVTFMVHDFFTEQPLQGADIYFFRMIFHDWSDKYSIRILQNLIPALKKGARIIACDTCMPSPGTIPSDLERRIRLIDLGMLANFNAKERDAGEWQALFKAADSRFVFKQIIRPLGSMLVLIEASWEE